MPAIFHLLGRFVLNLFKSRHSARPEALYHEYENMTAAFGGISIKYMRHETDMHDFFAKHRNPRRKAFAGGWASQARA